MSAKPKRQMTDIGRREFLRQAVSGLGYAAMGPVLYKAVLEQLFQHAYAQATGISNSTNYVHITLPGAPPRWMFDLPLTPEGKTTSNFIDGKFGTLFEKQAGIYMPSYKAEKFVVNGRDLYLPPVWRMPLAQQNFATLLPNTLFVRGMDMEINSHPLSSQRQVAPIIGGASVSGVAADASGLPIPAICDGAVSPANAFKSNKQLAMTQMDFTNTNPVAKILAPFKDFKGKRAAHSESNEKLGEQVLREFEKMAERRGVQKSALSTMYKNAMALIDSDVISLSDNYAVTVAKYKAIISEGLSPVKGTLPGLYDQPIASRTGGLFGCDNLGNFTTLNDLRDMFNGTQKIERLAESFATTELLIGKVSSSFVFGARAPSDLLRALNQKVSASHDQHGVGSMVSTLTTTLFYRAFLGCLTEFITTLKSKQMFDSTIIHISAEFNRTPKTDGSGSDHGFMAGNTTLISGMIDGGKVVGNITKQGHTNDYAGTFGVGGNFSDFNRPIQVNDVALTLTSMIGAPTIVTNGNSLLLPTASGKWVVAKDEAKNV